MGIVSKRVLEFCEKCRIKNACPFFGVIYIECEYKTVNFGKVGE